MSRVCDVSLYVCSLEPIDPTEPMHTHSSIAYWGIQTSVCSCEQTHKAKPFFLANYQKTYYIICVERERAMTNENKSIPLPPKHLLEAHAAWLYAPVKVPTAPKQETPRSIRNTRKRVNMTVRMY